MPIIKNSNIGLRCMKNGKGLTIIDFFRGETWVIDENSLVYGDVDNAGGHKAKLNPLIPNKAEKAGRRK